MNPTDLAAQGCAIFPCRADKAPATPHGHRDASRDLAAVRDLWRRFPGPLIGLPTGAANGIDVLDIDPRHGGDRWLLQHRDRLPVTRTHETRSGGLHLLFRHAAGVRNSAGRIAPGVDVRGEGGFIIYWPAAGCDVPIASPPADWPNWLLPMVLPPPPTPPAPRPSGYAPGLGAAAPRIAETVARVLARLEMAGPGQKHDRLRAAARTLGGLMDEAGFSAADAERVLMDAVRRAGGNEVVERNARATIAWGLERGRSAPLGGR